MSSRQMRVNIAVAKDIADHLTHGHVSFNSLFEMRGRYVAVAKGDEITSFNSLFEMREFKQSLDFGATPKLSILYLRCRRPQAG